MARRNEVTEKDMGWQRIQKEIFNAGRQDVKVGILQDSDAHEDGTDMILIALANEFGTDDILARPFIRGGFDQHSRALGKMSDRLWDQILAGRIDTNRALGMMGETHQGQVQEYMTALDTPPNKPRTIAQKRDSTNPLIDTGRLRSSIRWGRD